MNKNEDKEEYDMCQAVREWAEEERQIGRNEGWEESRTAVVRNLIRRGDTDEAIMQIVECSREYIDGIRKDMRHFSKNE